MNRRTAAWSIPAPAGAHRNAVRRSSSRARQERPRGDSDRVPTRRAPCGNAARGAPSNCTMLDHGRTDACRRGTCWWGVRNAGRVCSAPGQAGRRSNACRIVTRLCSCRNAVPVALPQRRTQLFVEPRQAGKEAPAKPAASPRADGLTATRRAAFRRTAPGREGGASEARRVATRQWACRNAARQWTCRSAACSFSSNRARQGRRRQRSPPRRHAPMALPQRRAQLLVEPRPAGSEAPLMPAASPRARGFAAIPRQWPYRNAARSFSSNHLSACAGE